MSNFSFLQTTFQTEGTEIYSTFRRAEQHVRGDARAAIFYSRRAVEVVVNWMYEYDSSFRRPYDDNLNALLRDSSFTRQVPRNVQDKMHLVRKWGNEAVHSQRAFKTDEAMKIVAELFHIGYWFARTYGPSSSATDHPSSQPTSEAGAAAAESHAAPSPLPEAFNPKLVPPSDRQVAVFKINQLKEMAAQAQATDEALRQQRAENEKLKAALAAAQAQVTERKAVNEQIPDTHDYSEAETREALIDVLLREAGWDPHGENVAEYEVSPMPNSKNKGFADYVLWGDDGLPLAVVEAKRASRDKAVGKRQAKLYADALEEMHGQRPIIFYTNGYETALWDDRAYGPREVQGFYTKEELQLLVQRRTTKQDLATVASNQAIAGRYYQEEAIRRICEHLSDSHRRALVVMATGTGKTRTTIALVDLLMRAGWVKRVLFLADRKTLVRQAVKAFKEHLPHANAVNLLEEKEVEANRVVASTYQTMMGQIDDLDGGTTKRFGVGHFDLVVVDEAHRSVYQKYRAIFNYFDSYLLGLTATPKDDVDHNTYDLFEVEEGVPTYAYDLDVAIADEFLVPPNPMSVPLKFMREGIRYDELSDDEQERWEMIEWDETGEVPDSIDSAVINRWLFNKDTVDQVLATLMEHGQKVAGGDRLGKTIIFAKNSKHAQYIQQRFDANYPHLTGQFSEVITYEISYAHTSIDDFGKKESSPHIAISVDMLDTGVDVPEVVNLVFFKLVRSKTKFFQMLGRGTRLCVDLFGIGEDKQSFHVFDVCQNFEFFNYNPKGVTTRMVPPLSQRIFNARLDLVAALRKHPLEGAETQALLTETTDALHAYVAAMTPENFLVRAQFGHVDPFQSRARWETFSAADLSNLAAYVSGLPSQLPNDHEAAKRFDLLALQLQLAHQEQRTKAFQSQRNRVLDLAATLQTLHTIPDVRARMELIQDVQTDLYWQAITLPKLEEMRISLREVTRFIEKTAQKSIETDFKDELGAIGEAPADYITGGSTASGINIRQYRKKVAHFLNSHRNHMVIHKIRSARPLTPQDLQELERFFFEADETGSREDFEEVYGPDQHLGDFIRRLVGLDRRAAKELFSRYLDNKTCTADQIQFVDHIINHLTKQGIMEPSQLYEQPFTDINHEGLDGIFNDAQADEIVAILRQVNESAIAKAA